MRPKNCIEAGGRWEVSEDLVESGQAWLYLVRDSEGKLRIAKALKNLDRVERFQREIDTMKSLSKKMDVIEILDEDLTCERPFYVMPYFSKGSLDKEANCLPFNQNLEKTVAFLLQLARLLKEVHATETAHRDLKPGNILVADDGRPVLCDLGLCWTEDGRQLTEHGEQLGARHYNAPEAINGRAGENPFLLDAYSFGKIAFQLLTGKLLLGGLTLTDEDRALIPPSLTVQEKGKWSYFFAIVADLISHDLLIRKKLWASIMEHLKNVLGRAADPFDGDLKVALQAEAQRVEILKRQFNPPSASDQRLSRLLPLMEAIKLAFLNSQAYESVNASALPDVLRVNRPNIGLPVPIYEMLGPVVSGSSVVSLKCRVHLNASEMFFCVATVAPIANDAAAAGDDIRVVFSSFKFGGGETFDLETFNGGEGTVGSAILIESAVKAAHSAADRWSRRIFAALRAYPNSSDPASTITQTTPRSPS